MSSHHESIIREPLITGENITYAKVTEDVLVRVIVPTTVRTKYVGLIGLTTGTTLVLIII